MPVWWCEELGTVLANEEVIDGKSEVGGFPVVRKPMRQWMLRITAYAERLLQDLDRLDWSGSLKEMQRNWIGRSEGAEVLFELGGVGQQMTNPPGQRITVFTTRPDTLFGATYMVLSPEHKLVDQITTPEQRAAVEEYQAYATGRSDLERTALDKEKTGVFTGAYAINPVNQERIPIWIADYVLISYGTGAIMAVPGHDTRDLEFARKFNLPIRVVVQAPEGKESVGFVDDGDEREFGVDQRAADAGGEEEDHRVAGGEGHGAEDGQLQAARLAVQPAALLGRAVPDCVAQGQAGQRVSRGAAGKGAAGAAAAAGGLQADRGRPAAAGAGDGVGEPAGWRGARD